MSKIKLLTHAGVAGLSSTGVRAVVKKRLLLGEIGKTVLRLTRNSAIGALAGAAGGGSAAAAGLRKDAAREGAIVGALVGGAATIPGIAVKASGVSNKAGIVFRRIRGRIIPIRVK